MTRARIFVASSSEHLYIAYAVQENLERDFEMTVWDQGVFSLSQTTLEALLNKLSNFDAAVFVFAPDDLAVIRGAKTTVARDNVIFELGLFIGRHGRDRTFLIMPRDADLHLPTDIVGMTAAEYSPDRSDRNWNAALGPACNRVRRSLGVSARHPPAAAQTVQPRQGEWTHEIGREFAAYGLSAFVVDFPELLETPHGLIVARLEVEVEAKRTTDNPKTYCVVSLHWVCPDEPWVNKASEYRLSAKKAGRWEVVKLSATRFPIERAWLNYSGFGERIERELVEIKQARVRITYRAAQTPP